MGVLITTSTSLAAGFVPKYWDRRIGENLRPRLYLYDFGDKRTIPMGTGKVIIIPRILKRTTAGIVVASTEGTATNLCGLSSQLISGTLQQFVGGYKHSDIIAMIGLSDVVNLAVKEIGYDMARQMDVFNWNQLSGVGLLRYGGSFSSTSNIRTADILIPRTIMKAVVTLDSADNPRFPGTNSYAGYIHPKVKYDIWSATSGGTPTYGWIDFVKYVDAGAERIFNGEVGKFMGVKFVESTRQYTNWSLSQNWKAGLHVSGSVSSALTQIFAPEAYYVTALEGLGAPQTFVKPLGSAGAADPANQYGTVAAKVFYTLIPVTYTSTETRIVRILHGRSLA